ncbi:MAG: T9SS type A sorting domain-containing protein, partial [Bacteroidetes bacterium]|nr:T9SS type A sorting domain-containing protein [Bacteroidota bacterium]
ATGNYSLTAGAAYGPTNFTWSYTANPPESLYSENISGAQRQPNGNTIICEGGHGDFTEVTAAGEIVWKYICPVDANGPMTQGNTIPVNPVRPDETMNSVFRVYRYPPDYAAFVGKDLTPGDFIELYPVGTTDQVIKTTLIRSYPNPFTTRIILKNTAGTESFDLANSLGQTIWSGKLIELQDFSNLASGFYFLKIKTQNSTQTIKIIKE